MKLLIATKSKQCLAFALLFSFLTAAGYSQSFFSRWEDRVTRTQAEQPTWASPLITVTPRLEQALRVDFVRQTAPDLTNTWNFGNGKGLDLVPLRHVELRFSVPPYLQHSSTAKDGFGDFGMLMKYRLLASNEQAHNYLLSAFLGGTLPTGSYKNGSTEAMVSPTLAGGKGIGRFDLQSTLGANLPIADYAKLGRPLLWNTALQYRCNSHVWTEIEFNNTHYYGGPNDGKTQNFVTPGLIVRFHLLKKNGVTMGTGIQIASSRFHSYNHALLFSGRIHF